MSEENTINYIIWDCGTAKEYLSSYNNSAILGEAIVGQMILGQE